MTATFENMDSVGQARHQLATQMAGGNRGLYKKVWKSLSGDGGAYREPVRVRPTQATPATPVSFEDAVNECCGHVA